MLFISFWNAMRIPILGTEIAYGNRCGQKRIGSSWVWARFIVHWLCLRRQIVYARPQRKCAIHDFISLHNHLVRLREGAREREMLQAFETYLTFLNIILIPKYHTYTWWIKKTSFVSLFVFFFSVVRIRLVFVQHSTFIKFFLDRRMQRSQTGV